MGLWGFLTGLAAVKVLATKSSTKHQESLSKDIKHERAVKRGEKWLAEQAAKPAAKLAEAEAYFAGFEAWRDGPTGRVSLEKVYSRSLTDDELRPFYDAEWAQRAGFWWQIEKVRPHYQAIIDANIGTKVQGREDRIPARPIANLADEEIWRE